MNFLRVYYHVETGRIAGWDSAAVAQSLGDRFIIVQSGVVPDFKGQIVDPISRQIREITAVEKTNLNAPNVVSLMVVRQQELLSSDWREEDPEWAAYRQALRDITRADDMLAAWPLRPDGIDAIALLKADMNA